MATLMFLQWNFISYMIPSRDFWAYSFFFVLLGAAFLDSKFILIITAEIVGSMFLNWIIRPELMLPVRDELFIPEMALRLVLIVLCFTTIWALTYTIEHRLAKELEKVSDFDTLTLLYNRRKLNQYIQNAMNQNTGKTFSLIMSDIDDFKYVNDTYGHSCGDEVLKDIANIMRIIVDDKGFTFRYGGEEILILVYLNQEETFKLANEIRKRVEDHNTIYEGKQIKVTMTFGIASYVEGDSQQTLIKRSDTNLYYGKNHGKNCVIQ